jgi:hypothetical protein
LNESKFNARVAEFRQSDDLVALRDELALCKGLIEDRLNAATTPAERAASLPLIRDLLTTLGTLVKAQRTYELQSGEVLTKDTLRKIGAEITQIIVDELGNMPDWDAVADRVCERLASVVETANNSASEFPKSR